MPRPLSPTDLERLLQSWSDAPLFDGLSEEHPQRWLDSIQTLCQRSFIPEIQWSDAAIYFLRGDLQIVMQAVKQRLQWEWQDFKSTLIEIWGQ
jgi:hypothetical protein